MRISESTDAKIMETFERPLGDDWAATRSAMAAHTLLMRWGREKESRTLLIIVARYLVIGPTRGALQSELLH